MTLTTLRRLVLLGNAAALLAAGGSAWHALEMEAGVRPGEEWKKLFPVRDAGAVDARQTDIGPLEPYIVGSRWPQGDKPVEKAAESTGPAPPPPDPFETKYGLTGVYEVRGGAALSMAQLHLKSKPDWPFSVYIGERIPGSPDDPKTKAPPTEWVLDRLEPSSGEGAPDRAFFRSFETGEEKVLSVETRQGRDLNAGSRGSPSVEDLPGGQLSDAVPGAPPRTLPPRFRIVSVDRTTGNRVIEVPQEEIEYLGFYADEVVQKISTETARGPDGKPDGFVLKSLPVGSRPQQMGFEQEDKILAVNGSPVTSKENAISVGKEQYEDGTRTFVVTVLRKGKEMNFTYKAPPKK